MIDWKAARHFDPTDYQYSEGENLKAAFNELLRLAEVLHSDCLASDFNEHWESYQALRKAIEESKK